MATVSFTKNYKDRSTDTAYQFEFFCDRSNNQWMPLWLAFHFPESCTYSYVSTAQTYPVSVANKVKDAASWLSTRFPQISSAGDAIKMLHKEAWDNAFNSAVQEAKGHFRHCPVCDKWVCEHSCFNEATRTCRACSTAAEIQASTQAPPQPTTVRCQHCHKLSEPGKFCDSCGQQMAMNIYCANCGKQIESDRRFRFCPHCGDSLSYLDEMDNARKDSA